MRTIDARAQVGEGYLWSLSLKVLEANRKVTLTFE
jgi:hypothetical protein